MRRSVALWALGALASLVAGSPEDNAVQTGQVASSSLVHHLTQVHMYSARCAECCTLTCPSVIKTII